MGDILEIKLDQVEGIGPQTLRKLRNANLWSTYDLILNIPKGYQDFFLTKPSDMKHQAKVTLKAEVISNLKDNPYGKVFSTTFDIKVYDQVIQSLFLIENI